MHPDPISGPNRKGWSAKTQFSNVLTSKYQVDYFVMKLDVSRYVTDVDLLTSLCKTSSYSVIYLGGFIGH